MQYRVVISKTNKTFPIKGLNELLAGRMYDYRTKKYHNRVKSDNDKICRIAIKKCLKDVKFDKQIRCIYNIYAPDKRHDRQNLYSVDKSFLDALQQCKCLKNDGWKECADSVFHTYLDAINPRIEVIIEEVEV
jgi:hypothetical protein